MPKSQGQENQLWSQVQKLLETNWQNKLFGFVLIEVFQKTFSDVNLLFISTFQVSQYVGSWILHTWIQNIVFVY